MDIRISLVVLVWLSTLAVAAAQEQTFRLPTATEVFNLRTKCAALGKQILEGNAISPTLTQSQISHYDPITNRCYVELTVQIADPSKPLYVHRYLFDGQTEEMLASTKIEKGERSGIVFDRQHQTKDYSDGGWDDATAYIDKVMANDKGSITPQQSR
jgi:hypothetical protein